MRQFSLSYSPLALNDLLEIETYIFEQSQERKTAKVVGKKIFAETKRLKQFPEIGVELNKYLNIKTDYRMLVVGTYNVFYRIEDTEVRVIRIFAGMQDWMTALFGENPTPL